MCVAFEIWLEEHALLNSAFKDSSLECLDAATDVANITFVINKRSPLFLPCSPLVARSFQFSQLIVSFLDEYFKRRDKNLSNLFKASI